MIAIAWDLRSADEHPALAAGGPVPDFLSAPERVYCDRLKTPRRRLDWMLGRFAAKSLCRAFLRACGVGEPPPSTALTVAPDEDGAPYVLWAGRGRLPLTISLSHRDGLAFCAIADCPDAPLGADLERCEPRSRGFVEDFFTLSEAAVIASSSSPHRTATELWSLKEAGLKALRTGLRVDTRRVEVKPRACAGPGWGAAELEISLDGAIGPTRGLAFVRDVGEHLATLAWLGSNPVVPSPSPLHSLAG